MIYLQSCRQYIEESTHSLTDKIPDSGSGAGGSIPSGCIATVNKFFI